MKISRSVLLLWSLLFAICGAPGALAQDESTPEPWNWSEERVRSAVNQVRAGRDLNPPSWARAPEAPQICGSEDNNEN